MNTLKWTQTSGQRGGGGKKTKSASERCCFSGLGEILGVGKRGCDCHTGSALSHLTFAVETRRHLPRRRAHLLSGHLCSTFMCRLVFTFAERGQPCAVITQKLETNLFFFFVPGERGESPLSFLGGGVSRCLFFSFSEHEAFRHKNRRSRDGPKVRVRDQRARPTNAFALRVGKLEDVHLR